jgi:L-2-hydroxycarboxylate dehydrogenase (NAD+)
LINYSQFLFLSLSLNFVMEVNYQKLLQFVASVFHSIGCPDDDANLAAHVLVSADARGIDSHGVARLAGYIRLYDNGRLNPKPNIRILHESPSTALVDGDRGLGLVVAPRAMEIATQKAAIAGTGWVAVQNSNHFGIAGYHAMKAVENDMIGWAMTHAAPLVTPTFSREKLLGTNPIAVGIPAMNEPAFLADFASTAVAYGKLEILQRKGLATPFGWVQDKDGLPSQDAFAIKNGGALLPLGGDREHGSHKGYALGAIVDILSGVLSGANFGPWVPPFATAGFMQAGETVGNGTGHFLGAMRIDAFRPADEFKNDMDKWIQRFRTADAVEGQRVIIPGDPERELEKIRKQDGIPLFDSVLADLKGLASRFSVDFNLE